MNVALMIVKEGLVNIGGLSMMVIVGGRRFSMFGQKEYIANDSSTLA